MAPSHVPVRPWWLLALLAISGMAQARVALASVRRQSPLGLVSYEIVDRSSLKFFYPRGRGSDIVFTSPDQILRVTFSPSENLVAVDHGSDGIGREIVILRRDHDGRYHLIDEVNIWKLSRYYMHHQFGLGPHEPLDHLYAFTVGWLADGVTLSISVRGRGLTRPLARRQHGGYHIIGWGAFYDVMNKKMKPDRERLGTLRWE